MASPFESASIVLGFPLYAVDFDAEDANRIVVGGGGGAGGTGVGNKIAVLETTSPAEMRQAGEIKLSSDEDSVMSLALGPRKGKTTYVYAGVNSSPDAIAKGTNEHLRTLAIEQPKAARASSTTTNTESTTTQTQAHISELSRTRMFTDADENSYQRLLRVVGQVGVASSAMGKEPQIGIFDAGGPSPKVRGVLELPREAEDLDIIQTGEHEYQIAFCYRYELHVVSISKEQQQPEPVLVYTMPDDHGERPVFRSIRYLTPNFILATSNLPKKSGVVIQGLRLPKPGHENARLAVNARIPGKISATALSVANLSAPASLASAASASEMQFLIAVARNDSAVSLYTLEHKVASQLPLLYDLYPLTTIKTPGGSDNLTGLAFSTFVPPKTGSGSSGSSSGSGRPQCVKLASISLQSTVAVYSIPLRKHVDKTPRNPKGPPRPARYVVAMKSQKPSPRPLIILLSVVVLILAVIGQGVMELYGGSRPVLHAHKVFPSWHGTLRSPRHQAAALLEQSFLANLVADVANVRVGQTLVLSDVADEAGEAGEADHGEDDVEDGETDEEGEAEDEEAADEEDEGDAEEGEDEQTSGDEDDGREGVEEEAEDVDEEETDENDKKDDDETPKQQIRVDVHQEGTHSDAKRWDELSRENKEAWKEKLTEAGKWTRDMGEGVFKGLLFKELAGAVGQAFAG